MCLYVLAHTQERGGGEEGEKEADTHRDRERERHTHIHMGWEKVSYGQ